MLKVGPQALNLRSSKPPRLLTLATEDPLIFYLFRVELSDRDSSPACPLLRLSRGLWRQDGSHLVGCADTPMAGLCNTL